MDLINHADPAAPTNYCGYSHSILFQLDS